MKLFVTDNDDVLNGQNFTVDMDKIKEETEYDFENFADLLYQVKSDLEFLESHNKNYNNKQYYKICDLLEIVKCIKEN